MQQVAEYVYKHLLNDRLCAYYRLGVPSKRWERLLCLFQLASDIGLLLQPRRGRIYKEGVEL